MTTSTNNQGSFRVPNSVIQGLTTATPAGLHELSPFTMFTLIGLISLVDQHEPHKEVRVRPSDLLSVLEISRQIAHEVERKWQTPMNGQQQKRYKTTRYSPTHFAQINEALLHLHNQLVVIRHFPKKNGEKSAARNVHLLDMFGYEYESNGTILDPDDLPSNYERTNVGTEDRPLWRLHRRTAHGVQNDRPSAILFRLNKELSEEIAGKAGTIKFTIIARRIFGKFRQVCRDGKTIRLLLLCVRQTEDETYRVLGTLLDELGFDADHRTRSIEQLRASFTKLVELNIVRSFQIDEVNDRVSFKPNKRWYKDGSQDVSA